MISDAGVSVEARPRVHVELPVGSVEHVGDVVSLEGPLVFGCVPAQKYYLVSAVRQLSLRAQFMLNNIYGTIVILIH